MDTQTLPTLHVRIVSPKGTVFEGQAYSVSSQNSVGKFDILPGHTNFITLIKDQSIFIVTVTNQTINLKVPLSVIYTTHNLVSIYTDIHLQLSN